MELCYAMISLDRLRQTILQNATDLHVAARVVIFVFFLLQTYDDMCQVSSIFKLKSIRFTINNPSSHYYPVDFPIEKSREVTDDCCCN